MGAGCLSYLLKDLSTSLSEQDDVSEESGGETGEFDKDGGEPVSDFTLSLRGHFLGLPIGFWVLVIWQTIPNPVGIVSISDLKNSPYEKAN